MTLLVAGADRVDAGKTTFSTGLLAYLDNAGYAPIGFKPRAGNDYWFDNDDVRLALSDGRLYGKDARRLAEASATDADGIAPERINPVHRLWRPTQDRTGMLGDDDRTFLVDRLTTANGVEFVVNGEAEDAGLLPEIVRESLPLDTARRVRSLEEFNRVMADRFLPAFNRLHERIDAAATDDPAVVESYSDIALPLTGLEPDAVAVVVPGRARIYRGDRYARACEVASGSPRDGRLEERAGAVEALIEPVSTVDLPALSANARKDPQAVADAYTDAYDALASLAELSASTTH